MDTSDLAGMADYQLIGDAFGYHSGYGSTSGQPTGQSGQQQSSGLPVGGNNMPTPVMSGLSAQGSAQAYHQLQSQHASRAAYPQTNDPLMSHKIHSQYPNYGSGGTAVQGLRGQYPTDPRYVQHGMSDYNSAVTQSHLSQLQSSAGTQPPVPSAYGQQNLMGQYAGQRIHTPGLTPSRQPTGAPMHGMPSHYSSSYPSAPTQSGYHSTPSSEIGWSAQGVPHMQQSSTYPGYPGSGGSGPSQSGPHSMHGPRGQTQYVSHSEYNAMHPNEQQRQYYSSTGGQTQTQSMTAHIPSDGSTLPYPTSSQGPYSSTSGSQPTPTRGPHSVPRQQYMGYNTPSLQSQPTSQQTQSQSGGASIPRYPQQYSGYPQTASYGESSAQSRLSPYPLSQQSGPAGPNSPQFRPGFPSSAGSQLSSLSPRRPTTTPPAGSPMPPSSHTPDRSSSTATSQSSSHQSSFPISPGANHLSSPGQGLSPGSSVPSAPSSLQQLEQMVMPHLGGVGAVNNTSKSSIPVSTNSSSSSTSSYYGSVGPNTPSTGAAPLSPQASNAGQRQTQGMYSHYPTSGAMPSNQSQYPYHQYQQNNSHWTGPQPNPIASSVASSSSSATSITNTHSMAGVSAGIPLQPQSTMASIGQSSTQPSSHQSSPTVASNSSSPNISKPDVSMPTNSAIGGQYNSYGNELNANNSTTDSNFSQQFVSRSTSSSTNSTPPSSSSSSSSQPLQSGYSQSTGSNSASFDSAIKAQHKQQVQQTAQGSQNDTQQSQPQQSQSQSAGPQMSSPTHMFDSIKSPNASTPRPLSDQSLANDLQPNPNPNQSNQSQTERMPNSQPPPQMMGPSHQPHHPYYQQQVHQSYPPPPQMGNYPNSYDPSVYDINSVTGDMSQSSAMSAGPYGDHDSGMSAGMMYDTYSMDGMVGQPMGDYHRDSADNYGQPIDPYSANFDDSFGEPPTKRKGKGRPKKDPNEPKKERKPRQPRAPRGSGRGRGRGSKNLMADRIAAMPPSVMIPTEYDPNYGMQSESMDLYSHEMYGQPMPPTPQTAIIPQQSQPIPSMPLNLPPAPQPQQQPPPPQAPPPPPQSPPPQPQQQTNHCQQQLQTLSPLPTPIPTPLQPQTPIETPITSPVSSVPSHTFTPPMPPILPIPPIPQPTIPSEPTIPAMIEKPLEAEHNIYDQNFLEQTTISDTNSLSETTLLSLPTEDETNISVAVASDGDMYSTPPRQVSPCPPPNTDDVIPEPKVDSFEFSEELMISTPLKAPKEKKPKKRKPKKEVTEPEVENEFNTESDTKPPKPKKAKKRKKKTVTIEPIEVKETPSEETIESVVPLQTDLDDATQESSQCDSSAIESSTGKGSAKKEKSKRSSNSRSKPRIKNKSPKKKLPKLALKFSKNKKRRRFGVGSPDHSDLERTPPPSPDDTETGIQKRRSARNTKRQKYTDDIELDLSEDDKNSSGILTPLLDTNGKPLGDGNVLSIVSNINEDTMVVEKIMASRLAQREIEYEANEVTETDPIPKPQTIEVEEFFVKYKNLSYFHCEWKTEEELEKGDRRMNQKIKRFRQKRDTMNMFDFLEEEPYNPDYIEVDRILDVNEIEEIIEFIPEKEIIVQKMESKEEIESKDETESQTNDSQTIETDKTETEPNSTESSLVPNDCEKTETEVSDSIETKDKSEDSEEKSEDVTKEQIEDNCIEDKPIVEQNECKTEDKIEENSETKDEEMDAEVEKDVNNENDKTEEEDKSEEEPKPEVKPVTRKVKHYLVKWRALAYEDSTWELEDDLDPIKIELFYRFRKTPPKSEWKPKRRPKPADWKKIEESPVYKGGNILREYQLEGLNWLSFCWHNNQNCILADEMGLGKTIQSLAFVNDITINYGIPGPFLIIAPLSTIGNWQREFETWTDLNVITYHGSSASRNMLQEYEMYYRNDKNERIAGIFKFQVMITTFEIVLTDCLELREIHWKNCIIDEAHRLKNRNCKLLEGLRLLDVEHRVLLTGTPLQNNVEELFSLLNFLEPTQFTSNESFMLEFGDLKTEAQVDKLKAILKPMMLRRLKEDVEKSLAPKEETIVEVELTNIQKKYYRAILERNFAFLSKGGTYANIPNLMNTMMELRKCCIHPFLINGAEDQIVYEYRQQHSGENEPTVNAIVNASGKLVLIDKLLPRLKDNGHRVLIFSQMVRCLDILEDYMVQRRYPYERIDGRVRGNLRQAAIDRFCKPDSDRFVFLLCTRAGGLGINLTAADTVIIFDSDWNPQNDLQAQARCHRIGQSKAVKVYRLICRNTYEREMFDKASLKLGLDRAVLQSINSSKANLTDNALSKKEIEDLLRKGAYGALMEDDNAGDKFCEEDIEQILQRRTQTVIIESEGKGSTFSKASFASSSNRSDIEIDDPNFWEKWAKKANFDVDELKGRNELIVQEPRRRTQTKRFGADDAVLDMSELSDSDEDDDSVSMRTRGGRNSRLPKGKKSKKGRGGGYERERDEDYVQEFGPGNWARAECYKVEKGLLTFGWGRWAECLVLGNFRRQLTRLDVEQISRVLLLFSLHNYKGDEKIKAFIWDLITPNEDGEHRIHRNHSGLSAPVPRGRKNKKMKRTVGEELEISDWAKDDKYNPEVLLTDDMYRKHLHRHANKILLRVRLLYYLKHEIIGEFHDQVFSGISARDIPIPPPVADGDPPAVWWDEEADKSLLVGVYKHGYDRFNLMRQDSTLCFLTRCGPPDGAALLAEMNADDDLGKTLEEDDEPETPATPATPLSQSECETTVKNKIEKTDSKEESEPNDSAFLPFPSPADMNHRLRRVITSYQRNFKKQEMKLAQRARHQQRIERLERFEAAIKERELKKRDLAQKKWSRREEADFYRVVSSFGVEYNRSDDTYDWTRFRSFGKLERKLDETLTEYFKAFYAMCKRVNGRRLTEEEENLPISVDPISEERASRTLARIDLLSKIREEILTHPELDERLQLCQHAMDLPEWWVCGRHDKDLLTGAAKYGLNRLDFNLVNDTEFSFVEVFKQLEANEQKAETKANDSEVLNEMNSLQTDIKIEDKNEENIDKIETKSEEKVDEKSETEEKPIDKELVPKSEDKTEVKVEVCAEDMTKSVIKDETNNKETEETAEKAEESKESAEKTKESVEKVESKVNEKVSEDHKEVKSPETETKTKEPEEKITDLKTLLEKKMDSEELKPEVEIESNKTETTDENEKPISSPKDKDIKEVKEEMNNEKDNEMEVKTEEEKEKISEELVETKDNEKCEEKIETEEKKAVEESDDNNKEKDQNMKSEAIEDDKKSVITEELTEKESSEIKTESETASVVTDKEVSITASSTPQPQTNQKTFPRFPKDRVLQMRLEQICHTVDKNEWPSLRHSFFSLLSGPHQSTPSVATADSSPRPISPGSLSSASREPTPHPTPDHTPRREALSPLPDFFYTDNSAAINESASRRRRRHRRRRFEVEAERQKLRNLLSQTIEQQQQQSLPVSKKQTSLLSGVSNQSFLPPLFSLPFCNLRSAIRDELMTDEKTASLLLGSTLQSSLAAAAASAQSSKASAANNSNSSSKGPPPAHQNSSSIRNNPNLGTLDLTGRFKPSPKMPTPPAPAHKPAPKTTNQESRKTTAQDVLDLSSVPSKRTRSQSPTKKIMSSDPNPVPMTMNTSKRSSRKIGSRIDALALNLQAKKMMEEKQIDTKADKMESNLSSLEKRQASHFMEELQKHSALLQNKTPPAAHSKSSSSTSSSKLNDSLLSAKSSALFGALDTSKLPPSKATEASTIAEQVAIIRQNLRNLFEDHPEFIAQNPSMASMVAASAANVFNPNLNMNSISSISSIPANTELLELPDSRRSRSRRSRVDPSQLDMQNLTGDENVSVINRTTGKKITGSKAPPLKHLAEWLDKNPKFDVDPKWSPIINKEKAATFKTPTSVANIGVRTRTSDKRSSSSSSNPSLSALASNLLNNNSSNMNVGSGSSNSTSSSRRSTAASLLASGYGNAFGNTAVTSSGLSYPSSAALNSFNASMLAGFPSMKMFMDPTSGATTASSMTSNPSSKSTSSSSSSTTTTTTSSSSAPPLFFPFGGLAGMGLANPLFGFPSFNLPGLTPNSSAMTGTTYSSDKKDSSENSSSNEKSKSSGKSSSSSGKNKSGMNSSSLLGSSASALGSGGLPFLYPSPNFLYNPLSLSGFSGLSGSPFGLPGLMNGLGGLSTTAMSGFTTNTTNTSSAHSKTKTTSSKASKSSYSSASASAPSGLSLASSLLASAGVHPSSAAAAAAIGDSDDDSLKSLMGNDDDDDLNGDFDDKDMNYVSDLEPESKSATNKKKSSNKSSKDITKGKTKGNSISTSKVSPN